MVDSGDPDTPTLGLKDRRSSFELRVHIMAVADGLAPPSPLYLTGQSQRCITT